MRNGTPSRSENMIPTDVAVVVDDLDVSGLQLIVNYHIGASPSLSARQHIDVSAKVRWKVTNIIFIMLGFTYGGGKSSDTDATSGP